MRTVVEGVRGCGWRKPGGLYLVSGNLSEPCPRLPVETAVCPTCGEGIKPARGFTWVDGGKLIPPTVHGTDEHDGSARSARRAPRSAREPRTPRATSCRCWAAAASSGSGSSTTRPRARSCPRRRRWASRGGSRRYPATSLSGRPGCSSATARRSRRRARSAATIPAATPSADRLGCTRRAGPEVTLPGIVTAFQPTAIEYVVKGDETEEELEALEARGIEPVIVERAEQEAML